MCGPSHKEVALRIKMSGETGMHKRTRPSQPSSDKFLSQTLRKNKLEREELAVCVSETLGRK